MEDEKPPGDIIDSIDNHKNDKLGEINDSEGDVLSDKVQSNVVETAKPKKSYASRIGHSFRRREHNIQLNNLGQEVVDPEKYVGEGIISHDTSRLDRKLQGRHMQMIAIGGAIGTGIIRSNFSYFQGCSLEAVLPWRQVDR
jgi:hypothetical protein